MVGSLVPLKVGKARVELHLGTIPVGVGSGGVGSGGSNSDYKAISVQLQLQLPTGTELGNIPLRVRGQLQLGLG